MRISAIVIACNEEENIVDCIKAVKFADEVVVVDNESKDKTSVLAKKKGAKVYNVGGLDFSKLRNFGKEKAKGEWLFYIDADERVAKELAQEILESIKKPKNYSAFSITRQNYYLGKPWPKREQVIRLIKKSALEGWQGILHESPVVSGKIGQLAVHLLHYTHNNLSEMVIKTNQWSEIEAQLRYKANHPPVSWWRFFRVMLTTFFRYYITEEGWKIGVVGLIESIYQSFSIFVTYAKLWEKQTSRIQT